jgi:predicted permease
MLPLTGQTNDWSFGVEGYVPDMPGRILTEQSRVVHGEYFRVLEVPLRSGRLFRAADTLDAPRVAIVSELFARKYWSDGAAIGRRIRRWGLDSDEPWTTIVGIVADIRHEGLDEAPVPFIYYPASQVPQSGMALLARLDAASPGGPRIIADAVRAVDPEQPTWSPRMMDEWRSRSISSPRFNLLLLSVFAALAMLLAAVGVYGVTAFSVARRTRELGIRVALGAQPRALLRFVVGEAACLAAVGCAAGGAGALAAGSWLRAAFHDVRLADPVVVAGIPLFVFTVAIAAAYLPARRAMRVDPADALRAE